MKNVKRVFALLAVLAALAAGTAGCSNNPAKTADKEAVKIANQYITLGNYKGVKIVKQSEELTQEDIDAGVTLEQSKHAYYASVDRAAAMYDYVNVDMTATVNGVDEPGFNVSDYDIYIGLGAYVMDGFSENLVGMTKGTNTFKMVVPDTFSESYLIGKEVEFTVVINSILGITYPEFNDEFVQSISEYKTTDEYMKYLEEKLAKEKKDDIASAYKLEAWTQVVDATQCSGYPEGEVEKKIEELKEQFEIYANIRGITVDEYITQNYGMSLEEYAQGSVKQMMMFDCIADAENLSITDKEYESRLSKFAERNGYSDSNEFVEKFGKDTIIEAMLWDEVQQFIVDNAEFVEE